MRSPAALLVVFLGCTLATPALARQQPALAQITAVQPPAWIETGNNKQALAAGRVLLAGDRILTGDGARVHVELAEASIIKLGENADFRLPRLQLAGDGADGGVFKSAVKVLKGAFRFTTRALGKTHRREVDVSIGVATAGIRGTDIWGKSDRAQDLIALLEGKIEVSSEGYEKQTMDQAGTAYVVPRGKPPQPVSPVPAEKIPDFARQTEMIEDQVAMFVGGPFSVVVGRFDSREAARAEAAKLSDKGYAAEVAEKGSDKDGNGRRHHVVMRGFGSRGDANRFARHLRRAMGARDATFVPNF